MTHPFYDTISAQIFLVRILSYSFETEIEICISASSFFSYGIVIRADTYIQVCRVNSYEISTVTQCTWHVCLFAPFGILCKLVVSFHLFFFMWINSHFTKCFLVWSVQLWHGRPVESLWTSAFFGKKIQISFISFTCTHPTKIKTITFWSNKKKGDK